MGISGSGSGIGATSGLESGSGIGNTLRLLLAHFVAVQDHSPYLWCSSTAIDSLIPRKGLEVTFERFLGFLQAQQSCFVQANQIAASCDITSCCKATL
jgi:hypothetical protein